MKLPLKDLNHSPYPPHLINTYTYGVNIAPKMCGGKTYFVLVALFLLRSCVALLAGGTSAFVFHSNIKMMVFLSRSYLVTFSNMFSY